MSSGCVRTGSQPAVMAAAAVQQLRVCVPDDAVAVVQLLHFQINWIYDTWALSQG